MNSVSLCVQQALSGLTMSANPLEHPLLWLESTMVNTRGGDKELQHMRQNLWMLERLDRYQRKAAAAQTGSCPQPCSA
jgi:hypothetical protein